MTDAHIFQAFGLVYVAVGLGMFFNAEYYKTLPDKFLENPAVMYLGGGAAFIVGYCITAFHNVWVLDWPVIITVLGWMALIKGLCIFAAPNAMKAMTKKMLKAQALPGIGIIVAAVGLVFIYLGYFSNGT